MTNKQYMKLCNMHPVLKWVFSRTDPSQLLAFTVVILALPFTKALALDPANKSMALDPELFCYFVLNKFYLLLKFSESCVYRITIACWVHLRMLWISYIMHTSIQLFCSSNTNLLNKFGNSSFFAQICAHVYSFIMDIEWTLLNTCLNVFCLPHTDTVHRVY